MKSPLTNALFILSIAIWVGIGFSLGSITGDLLFAAVLEVLNHE